MRAIGIGLLLILQPWLANAAERLSDFALASWNIQTLATEGRKVFDNSAAREGLDYADLQVVRDSIDADVYVLQEITSPAALALVFPLDEYVLCFTGQWTADAEGMGPAYDFDAVEASDVGPKCWTEEGTDLPDTEVTPDLAPNQADPLLAQYVAIAVRRDAGIAVTEITDIARLGVSQNDSDGAGGFTVRTTRWGLDALLSREGETLRLLNVHMKSGCFDGFLREDLWNAAADIWTPAMRRDHPCEVYARQLISLRRWLSARIADEQPFAIVGDFNRRLDLELLDARMPDLWPIITGVETAATGDEIALTHIPRGETIAAGRACWPFEPDNQKVAIDFFVFGPEDEPADWQTVVTKLHFTEINRTDGSPIATGDLEEEAKRLSDHCPRRIRL